MGAPSDSDMADAKTAVQSICHGLPPATQSSISPNVCRVIIRGMTGIAVSKLQICYNRCAQRSIVPTVSDRAISAHHMRYPEGCPQHGKYVPRCSLCPLCHKDHLIGVKYTRSGPFSQKLKTRCLLIQSRLSSAILMSKFHSIRVRTRRISM